MLINNKFTVLQFSEELIDDFILLFNQSFTKGRNIDRKRVSNTYINDNYIGFLAYDYNKPIAFYGIIIFDFKYNDQSIKVGQSINSMVLPSYRKYNLFYHLADLTNNLAKTNDVKFIFGLPNSPELFHKVLDWSYLGSMKKYSFKICTLPFAKLFWKINYIRFLYVHYFKLVINILNYFGHNCLLIKDSIDNNYHIPRLQKYIIYKKKLGANVIKINKTSIIISIDYRLKVGDLEDVTIEKFTKIIKKLKRMCFWLGICEICFSVDNKSDWNEILSSKYQSKDDMQLMYIELDNNYTLDTAHITLADYDTF